MQISELIILLEKILKTNGKKTSSDLFYYPKINIWATEENTRHIKQFANLSLTEWIKQKKTKQILNIQTHKSLLIRKSLNGFVILNSENNQVIKIQHKKFEPNFIINEETARNLLPKHTFPAINTGTIQNYQYQIFPFIIGSHSSWKKWNKTLQKSISPIYKQFLQNNIIKKTKSAIYIKRLKEEAKLQLTENKFLKKEFTESLSNLNNLASKYSTELNSNTFIYTSFVHGDLVPNNVLKTKDNRIIFLDWSNGGIHSIFYDLLLQDFYNSSSKTWVKFNYIDFTKNSNKKIFHGWSKHFCQLITETVDNKYISNTEIKLSILAALYEIATKNFLRYQTIEEQRDGAEMLTIVSKICSNIYNNK